jgi:ATP-dependent protease ClpP protease subunit
MKDWALRLSPSARYACGFAALSLAASVLGSAQPVIAADTSEIFRAARGAFQVTLPNSRTAYLQGRIQAGDEIVFQRAITDQVDTVVVNSGGGDVIPALKMAELIRARGLRVVVDGACVSSCANYLFVAGRNQEVRQDSVVLWHGGVTDAAITDMTSALRSMMASTGSSPEVIAVNVERTDKEMRTAMADQRRLYRAIGINLDVVENLSAVAGDATPVDGFATEGQPFIFIDYGTLRCAGLKTLGQAWLPRTSQEWTHFKQRAGIERLAIGRSVGLQRRLCTKGG